jgi:hypothetical protein
LSFIFYRSKDDEYLISELTLCREEPRQEAKVVEPAHVPVVERVVPVEQPSTKQAEVKDIEMEETRDVPATAPSEPEKKIVNDRATEEVTFKSGSGVFTFYKPSSSRKSLVDLASKPADTVKPVEAAPAEPVKPVEPVKTIPKPVMPETEQRNIPEVVSAPVPRSEPQPTEPVKRDSVSNSTSRRSVQELAKYVNQVLLDRAIDTVCTQVAPSFRISTSGLRLIKNYILHLLERLLNGGAIKLESKELTVITLTLLDGKRTLTLKSVEGAVTLLFRNTLAKYAVEESNKAVQRYRESKAKEEGELDNSQLTSEPSVIVFPTHLFQGLILNGRFVSEPKHLQEEALVFLSASMEYFTAELLELASTYYL